MSLPEEVPASEELPLSEAEEPESEPEEAPESGVEVSPPLPEEPESGVEISLPLPEEPLSGAGASVAGGVVGVGLGSSLP